MAQITKLPLLYTMLVASTIAQAQIDQRREPFETKNPDAGPWILANELEGAYQTFNYSCGLPTPLVLSKKKRLSSAIDPVIINALSLDGTKTTARPIRASLGTAFSYVWSTAEKAALDPKWETPRVLQLEQQKLDALPVSGLPAVIESSGCGSAVATSASAQAKGLFPIATVEAALRAETKRDQQAQMIMMNGQFRNPLWQMWIEQSADLNTRQASKLFAALIFWDWRSRPTAPGDDAVLLVSFSGSHIFQTLRSNTQMESSAKLDASLSYTVVNVDTTSSSAVTKGRELSMSNYKLLMDPGTYRFENVPTPDQLRAEFAKAQIRADSSAGTQVEGDQPLQFAILFSRLPRSYCVKDAWEVLETNPAKAGEYEIESSREIINDDTGVTECRFTVKFTPAGPQSPVEKLSPAFSSRAILNQAGAARLQIPVKLKLTRQVVPTVEFQSAATFSTSPYPGPNPSSNVIIRYSFAVSGMAAYGNATVGTDGVRIDCPHRFAGAHPSWTSTLIGNGPNRTLELTGASIYNGALPAIPTAQDCQLSGFVTFRKNGGNYDVPSTIGNNKVAYPDVPVAASIGQ